MKSRIICLCLALCIAHSCKAATLYDCRTDLGTGGAPNLALFDGVAYNAIRQYFSPKLSGLDFVELFVSDGAGFNGRGATMFIEIRDTSRDFILGVSEPVTFVDYYGSYARFEFSNRVALTPGSLYAFAPHLSEFTRDPLTSDLVLSDPWNLQLVTGFGQGAVGLAKNGMIESGQSLLFREGMTVPEPSANFLMLLGAVTWLMLNGVRQR